MESKDQSSSRNFGSGELSQNAVPDLLKLDLKVLFIGINPGLRSGETGKHFAGRSNRFWRFLAEAGLTSVKYQPAEMERLLELGYGITNIVSRVTATAAELNSVELRAGAERLREILRQYRPRIVVYLGKVVYQHVAGSKNFAWGLQAKSVVDGIVDFVMPNPSGLNRMPIPEQLELFRELKKLAG